jgi:hypothetical protein
MAARKWTSARVVKVWLDVVLALGGVIGALLVLYLLFSPLMFRQEGGDVSVVVAIGPHSFLPRMPLELASPPSDGGDGSSRAYLVKGYGELRTATTDLWLHLASMLFFVLGIGVVLYTVWILRQVLVTALAGEPFAPANSRRLRWIGFIVLALAVVAPCVEYLLGQAVLARLAVEGLRLSPAFRFSTDFVLVGLLFLVLAAIFRHGTELEEERALTV